MLPVTQRVHNAIEFIFFNPPAPLKEVSIAKDSGRQYIQTFTPLRFSSPPGIEQQVFKIFEIQAYDGSFGQCFTYRLPEGR